MAPQTRQENLWAIVLAGGTHLPAGSYRASVTAKALEPEAVTQDHHRFVQIWTDGLVDMVDDQA